MHLVKIQREPQDPRNADAKAWDFLLGDEVNRLLPKRDLDAMAATLGLELCHFRNECDCCARMRSHSIGRTWASISYGEVTETNFYCCDACLPEKFREHLRDVAYWNEGGRCFVCAKVTCEACENKGCRECWEVRSGCNLCRGTGIIFRSVRPYNARAELNFTHAIHRAEVTTGRRQKHWRRVAIQWHKRAVRDCAPVKKKEPPKRSIAKCERCGKVRQRPWLDLFRRYGRCCLSCSWLNVCDNLNVDPVTLESKGGDDAEV